MRRSTLIDVSTVATFPLAIGIIADTYPIERRAQGFVIVPTTYAIASVMGSTGSPFGMNCGKRAMKKTASFGFAKAVMSPVR